MRLLGYLLLWGGFIVGAYFSVNHAENQVDARTYLPALVLCAAGVALGRLATRREATHADTLTDNVEALRASLDGITRNIRQLDEAKQQIDVYDLHRRIDATFLDDLSVFVEARKSIIHLFGLQSYADVMSDFAAGERYLNRVWSASVDGYVDECHSYITRSREQFEQAQQKLAELRPS